MICGNQECRAIVDYLKYGMCEECFRKWPERDNPEPDAKKKRNGSNQKHKGDERGHFIVKGKKGFYSTKRKEPVEKKESTVFSWFSSAEKIAAEIEGNVLRLEVVK